MKCFYVATLLVLGWVSFANAADREVDFQADVKPVLEQRCIGCHGPNRQKGGLRLDTRAAALAGGDSGPALVAGKSTESLLYQRAAVHEDDPERMPAEGAPLTAQQILLLKNWIDRGAAWSGNALQERRIAAEGLAVPKTASKAALLKNKDRLQQHVAQIDTYVHDHLRSTGVNPNEPASDEVFVRRVYLDIAGRIPTLEEYEAFMKAPGATKRDDLIDTLIDSPGFVSHTLNLWMDALRVKSAHRKMQADSYIVWLRKAIQHNMPYDQFVREQLTASGHIDDPETAATGYFIRDQKMPQDLTATTMQLFLGTSMVCAQCHDHPSAKWTQMDFYKLQAFFNGTVVGNGGTLGMAEALEANGAQVEGGAIITADGRHLHRVRTEHHYKVLGDVVVGGGYGKVNLPDTYAYANGKPNELIEAGTPFGSDVHIDYRTVAKPTGLAFSKKVRKLLEKETLADVNSRIAFADWATSPENPMFTKTIVNRLWCRVFGVPLVGDLIDLPESDMGPVPELTAYLIALMKSSEYDQKLVLRMLYRTDAYERVALDPPAIGEMPIGAPIVQRLSAEQIWDSLVALRSRDPDGNLTKGTLAERNLMYEEMTRREGKQQWAFVSDPRPLEQKADPRLAKELVPKDKDDFNKRASLIASPGGAASFLGVFGQAGREIIDDSVREATITQALYLMNGAETTSLFSPGGKDRRNGSELAERLQSDGTLDDGTIRRTYNAVLNRNPSAREMALVKSRLENADPTALEDLIWSLVNTTEFKLKR